MGEGCELWGGNERKKWDEWGGMYVCGGGEEKNKGSGYMGGREKKNEIKRKKEMGNGVYVYSGKERRKKFEREKTKLVLFVYSLCLVQSVEL